MPAFVAGSEVPPDHGSVICNHYLPKGTTFPDVRCNDPETAGKILLFIRGTQPKVALPIQNDRSEAIHAEYVLEFLTRDGKEWRSKESGPLLLPPKTATTVSCTIDTRALPFGVYSLMLRVTTGGAPLTEREYYFGVISDVTIPKSSGDSFLYGLAPNYGGVVARAPKPAEPGKKAQQGQCDLLAWIDASGADILRSAGFGIGPGAWAPDFEELEIVRRHGLKVMGMAWPPSPMTVEGGVGLDKAFSPSVVKKWLALAEEVARKAPDVLYWEVGNEPDLGYPGIEHYVPIYEATYQAIKRGNPKARVSNGGITFFGAKGPANSRRFLELVKPGMIDVLAYHAHGPGSVAERRIFEQLNQTAREFGKGDKPVIDTESGMFVGSRKQEEVQAWMVAQKQAYAQSVGVKFVMTFCLHAFRHGDMAYGLLRSDRDPNPAFVAYRAMTEHLKGLKFQQKLKLTQTYAEGYSFAEPDGPRRACLLWSNQPAFYNVYLKTADASSQIRKMRVMDIYGNASPVEPGENGIVRMEITEAPVYLLWEAEDRFQVSVTRSMLRMPDMATLAPNTSMPLDIGIENPSEADWVATLSAAINAPGRATVTPEKQVVRVSAKQTAPVSFALQWEGSGDLTWSKSWRVFTDLKQADVDLATLVQEPDTINGMAGRTVDAVNHAVSLLRAGELPQEKRAGYVFGTVHSERDQVVRVGCAADWWMEFRVNGAIVCSTLDGGNQGMTVTERVLDLPLRKGANLLAFKVLSGKGGWSVTLVSPADLPALLDPRRGGNRVDLVLEINGKVLANERLSLCMAQPVALLGGFAWTDPVQKWAAVKTDISLGGAHVINLFDKMTDRSKWWQGEKDLSAEAWMRCDARRLYLIVRVADDKDVAARDPAAMATSDSLQVAIAKGPAAFDLYSIGRVGGNVVVCREQSSGNRSAGRVESDSSEISAVVERNGDATLYRIALDRSWVGNGVFRLNFLVNDNDEGYRKQCLQWTSGLEDGREPLAWQQLILSADLKQ